MSDAVDSEVGVPLTHVRPRRVSLLQLIKEDVGCVRLRDPAARSELETLLTYPGVHALSATKAATIAPARRSV